MEAQASLNAATAGGISILTIKYANKLGFPKYNLL